MSQSPQNVEFYDDGLVHSHDWASATPPGGNHAERRAAERDEARREAA